MAALIAPLLMTLPVPEPEKVRFIAVQAGVVDVQSRGDQAADVDLRALAEQDAVRVDQIHLAVGVQMAEDLRAVGVGDAVDRYRAGRIGLLEVDRFVRGDVEALPVGRQVLAGLVDGGGSRPTG